MREQRRPALYQMSVMSRTGQRIRLDDGIQFRRFDLLRRWLAAWQIRHSMQLVHWRVPISGSVYINKQGRILFRDSEELLEINPRQRPQPVQVTTKGGRSI